MFAAGFIQPGFLASCAISRGRSRTYYGSNGSCSTNRTTSYWLVFVDSAKYSTETLAQAGRRYGAEEISPWGANAIWRSTDTSIAVLIVTIGAGRTTAYQGSLNQPLCPIIGREIAVPGDGAWPAGFGQGLVPAIVRNRGRSDYCIFRNNCTFSRVWALGNRPRRKSATNRGSPTTTRPNLLGGMRVRARYDSICSRSSMGPTHFGLVYLVCSY